MNIYFLLLVWYLMTQTWLNQVVTIVTCLYLILCHIHSKSSLRSRRIFPICVDLRNWGLDIKRNTGTVNPLLFATTIFCKLPEINWLAATNFHGQFLSTPFLSVHLHVYGKNWFVTRNIRNNETLRTSQKFLTHE